jgi:hypothetical protein
MPGANLFQFAKVSLTGTPFGLFDQETDCAVSAGDYKKLTEFIGGGHFPVTP